MEIYDLIMLLVLVGTTAYGAYKGLAWQVTAVSSIFLSYFVAYQFRTPVAAFIKTDPPWNLFLAMLILYVATSVVIWVAFQFVKEFIDRLRLKEFDRQIGALLGLVKGVLLCVIITLFCVTLLDEPKRAAIIRSRSGYYIALLLQRAHPLIPEEVHQVIHPYLEKLDENVGEPGHQPQAPASDSADPEPAAKPRWPS